MACPSDDECTKTITIPQFYIVGNQTYSSEITQEVPCNFPEPTEPELIEPPTLENFTYQILSFDYVAETSDNTTLLQYEIQLNNHNDFNVEGVPIITVVSDGLQFSGDFTADALEPCNAINANSSCILVYNSETPIENILPPTTYEIIDVEYVVINN